MDISLIIPAYKPDKKILKQIKNALKKQDFNGKIHLLIIDEGLGLADSLNYGIKKAKTEILILMHQDCIPTTNDWVRKLVEPLNNKEIVVSIGKEELPFEFWNKFDLVAKILSAKEQKELVTFERACAVRKSTMIKIGMFNGEKFRTAGEDVVVYRKLQKEGKFAFPNVKIWHYHYYNTQIRLKKELQLSNAGGALLRMYGFKYETWPMALLKSLPILGWPIFIAGIEFKKLGFNKSLLAIPLFLLTNLIYSYGFWKGFISGKQTV